MGDLNSPYVDCKVIAGGNSGTQAWENIYIQAIDRPTRRDALLEVFLVRTESSVTSSVIVQGVSDHEAVTFEVEWEDTCREPHVERIVPVYKKKNV